jgi:hypothetical protein
MLSSHHHPLADGILDVAAALDVLLVNDALSVSEQMPAMKKRVEAG